MYEQVDTVWGNGGGGAAPIICGVNVISLNEEKQILPSIVPAEFVFVFFLHLQDHLFTFCIERVMNTAKTAPLLYSMKLQQAS